MFIYARRTKEFTKTGSEMPVHSRGSNSQIDVYTFLVHPRGSNWNLEMLVSKTRENLSTQRKASRSREENQQQLQLTYDARSVN